MSPEIGCCCASGTHFFLVGPTSIAAQAASQVSNNGPLGILSKPQYREQKNTEKHTEGWGRGKSKIEPFEIQGHRLLDENELSCF